MGTCMSAVDEAKEEFIIVMPPKECKQVLEMYATFAERLDFTQRETLWIYQKFKRADRFKRGVVDAKDLRFFFEVSNKAFGEKFFSIWLQDDALTDFKGFLFWIWNVCTASRTDLKYILYMTYDSSESGTLSARDVICILEDTFGPGWESHKGAQAIIPLFLQRSLRLEYVTEDLTAEKFSSLCDRGTILTYGVFQATNTIVEIMGGTRHWELKATQKQKSMKKKEFIKTLNENLEELNGNKSKLRSLYIHSNGVIGPYYLSLTEAEITMERVKRSRFNKTSTVTNGASKSKRSVADSPKSSGGNSPKPKKMNNGREQSSERSVSSAPNYRQVSPILSNANHLEKVGGSQRALSPSQRRIIKASEETRPIRRSATAKVAAMRQTMTTE